jgi:hypothetical protein
VIPKQASAPRGALLSIHFLARPHLLSYPCLVLWLAGLVRAVEGGTYPSLLLLPVMTFWANLHGGFFSPRNSEAVVLYLSG